MHVNTGTETKNGTLTLWWNRQEVTPLCHVTELVAGEMFMNIARLSGY